MSELAVNVAILKQKVVEICDKCKRSPAEIKIVAVSKNVEPERIKEVISLGLNDIGENRVQEASGKKSQVSLPAVWHMVGHLQTNKVKKALEIFDYIQSVDSFELAQTLSKRAEKPVRILIEVSTSEEPAKFGVEPEKTAELVKRISELKNLHIEGLMTVGPLTSVSDKIRSSFKKLKELFENLKQKNIEFVEMKHLSMGMSADYQIAIQEGSNMLRVGIAIFGPRK